MKRVCVIEWTDKNGIVYRCPPFDENDLKAMTDGIRSALYAMCKPSLKHFVMNEDGILLEP